jgi:phytoene dehydrogenase-like protein
VEGGRAAGVVTATGEEVRARAVACNANCKVLFEQMLPAAALPPDFLAEIRSFRTFSTAFKINAACEAPPRYTAFDQTKTGFAYPAYVHLGPDIDYLERAYDDAKHGWYSSQPFVTPVVPTTVDDTIAPAGKATRPMSSRTAPGSRSATASRAPCSPRSIASRPDFRVRSSTCRSWCHPTSSAF